ncbi:bifunctional RNA recognition motif domain/Nucleotide-binding alpha-beta plait domain superfamily/SF3B4 [Babesia duncani]|uniref:Bifunctional RNA recognition motif domain/Nucleotide-binding alpha-beta plait domain superfamily/SF3B4 n=1 Tax=Babesia duncani TaxID=323732 RepID=A0AAD9PLN1_9APIC|nr:bifunctional RNA recognition motif domain/Nucleotide-binding alpha-beta plait domain superfamily/SF3B4 [Babesia duncani]
MLNNRASDLLLLYDRNQDATLYIGNVDTQVDEELLWELFVQVGVVKNVHIPRDKVSGHHQGYAFIEYETEEDADYALRTLNFVKLFSKPLKCNKAAKDRGNFEIGANLFVGNLDDEVDDRKIHEAFSSFGNVVSAKVVRDTENGEGKTYAFVSYDNFESSDAALAAMNGQFFCNKPIHVSYAYKKDTKGERHGTAAERLIAANRPISNLGHSNGAIYPPKTMHPPQMATGLSQMPSFPGKMPPPPYPSH